MIRIGTTVFMQHPVEGVSEMAERPRKARYTVKTLSVNLIEFLPENKGETDAFLTRVCDVLMHKSRVQNAIPGVRGVRIVFIGSGLTPNDVTRFQRSVDEIIDELLATPTAN